jgi:hypothetical protein
MWVKLTPGLNSQGDLNKDATVWLDGRPCPMSLIVSSTNLQFDALGI